MGKHNLSLGDQPVLSNHLSLISNPNSVFLLILWVACQPEQKRLICDAKAHSLRAHFDQQHGSGEPSEFQIRLSYVTMCIFHHSMQQCSLKEYDEGSKQWPHIAGSYLFFSDPRVSRFGVRTQLTEASKQILLFEG